MVDFGALREKMVREQIIARGIEDKEVIRALCNIPREKFIPHKDRVHAYEDRPLPISLGQTISQPYMVALMTQVLEVKPQDKILEIGTGSGYQAAILSYLGAEVYSIEREPILAKKAREVLSDLGYKVKIKVGDGSLGWEEEAPFDKVIVTAATPDFPPPLLKQVKIGGKIVVPIGSRFQQCLTVVNKVSEEKVSREEICGCIFVPLIGKYGYKK